jgi:hypothetical protein
MYEGRRSSIDTKLPGNGRCQISGCQTHDKLSCASNCESVWMREHLLKRLGVTSLSSSGGKRVGKV